VCVNILKKPKNADVLISEWKAILQDAIDKKHANTGVPGKKDKNVIINRSGTSMTRATLPCHRLYAN
jgi:hypothetical protein